MNHYKKRTLLIFCFCLTTLNSLAVADTWTNLKTDGKEAAAILKELEDGKARSLLQLLTAGLNHEHEGIRHFCAEIVPADMLLEEDLKKLFTIRLANKGKQPPAHDLPEETVDRIYTLVSTHLAAGTTMGLAEIAGWGDQEKLLNLLLGASKGLKNKWAAKDKEGRQARTALARALFPITDNRALNLAADKILDSKWRAKEQAPLQWLVRSGTKGLWPGKKVIQARIKSLLKGRDASQRRTIITNPARIATALPLLTSYPQALPLVREALITAKKIDYTLPLWVAARVLVDSSLPSKRCQFWAQGAAPLAQLLKKQDDPALKLSYYFFFGPALGGTKNKGLTSAHATRALLKVLAAPLRRLAKQGDITSDSLSGLFRAGNIQTLTIVLDALPEEDLKYLLAEPRFTLEGISMATARTLAKLSQKGPRQIGEAALKALEEKPENQSDKLLLRLVPLCDLSNMGVLAEALRRDLIENAQQTYPWWDKIISEDNPDGAPVAQKYPSSFRSFLESITNNRIQLFSAISWCARHGVNSPWKEKISSLTISTLIKIMENQPCSELPMTLKNLAPWLTSADREDLGEAWLNQWSKSPETLDAGDAMGDFQVLNALFHDHKKSLVEHFNHLITASKSPRILETSIGGLVKLGHPPTTAQITTALDLDLPLSPFLNLHACPVLPLLKRLQKKFLEDGDLGWDNFLTIAWCARQKGEYAPSLPVVPDPEKEWWEMASAGRFTAIYQALLERSLQQSAPRIAGSALRGIALCATTKKEKSRALIQILPCLNHLQRALYWDAIIAAAHLDDSDAKAVLTKALAAGRRFFFRDHLLPWIRLNRSFKWADFLAQKAFPGAGLLDHDLKQTLNILLPELQSPNMGNRKWAKQAVTLSRLNREKVKWDPIRSGWIEK